MFDPKKMTFYKRFTKDILAGSKTITIRDSSESHYKADTIVEVRELETGRLFTHIKINSVQPIHFNELTERHAKQENMSLPMLQKVIADIYPNIKNLYVIDFNLCPTAEPEIV
ncbi:N(4)-acetylcytidine aminohydrolase [Shewanella intestini]|uniref:N(4)-acetylcytidine amidohydrolase n=1 Tax=Shewanella intestini TaxID=2017544 RepID=A0ABS5HZE3_9GAMM|nr:MULTISPECIES: N(4)-acetylcytidine aminohydrolase [Shewanella]MBR9727157.1 ASCH domain-containing protein [Shewanella intestini]MRG35959.1 ASCH domain-containing protein [Shewanella sp. XMDDZSB0408]